MTAKTAAVLAEVKRLGNEKQGLLTDEEFAAIVVNFSKYMAIYEY